MSFTGTWWYLTSKIDPHCAQVLSAALSNPQVATLFSFRTQSSVMITYFRPKPCYVSMTQRPSRLEFVTIAFWDLTKAFLVGSCRPESRKLISTSFRRPGPLSGRSRGAPGRILPPRTSTETTSEPKIGLLEIQECGSRCEVSSHSGRARDGRRQ